MQQYSQIAPLTGVKGRVGPRTSYFFECDRTITTGAVVAASTVVQQRLYAPLPDMKTSTATLLLVGTASAPGYLDFDGKFQPAAGGESVLCTFVIERGAKALILEQFGYNNTNPASNYLKFSVDYGTSTDPSVSVGSAKGRPQNNYGANGCPDEFSDVSNLSKYNRIAYGATRPYPTIISYSDNTSYAPNPNATYGSATRSFSLAGRSITAYFGGGGTTNSGIIMEGVRYGYAAQAGYGTAPNTQFRTPEYAGCALIEIVPYSLSYRTLRNLK